MSLATKALFVIERSLDDDLTLEAIAQVCGASRFHLAHAFGRATGFSVFGATPPGCERITLAPALHAVFRHAANVTRIGDAHQAICNPWFPASDRKAAEAPRLERPPNFGRRSGEGGVGMWVPLRA